MTTICKIAVFSYFWYISIFLIESRTFKIKWVEVRLKLNTETKKQKYLDIVLFQYFNNINESICI